MSKFKSVRSLGIACLGGIFTMTLFFMASPPLFAQTPNRDDVIRYAAESGERFWKSTAAPPPGMDSRALFTYALALCETKTHPDRLQRLFELGKQMQDRDPNSRGYGNFRWNWGHTTVEDFNAVEFCMQGGALLWLRHRDSIPSPARETLREILEFAVQGCLRHRVSESYTNIALMNALNLIVLGEALVKPDVADEGYARLDRICMYTWECGIHEYCSPTYYGTDLDSLVLLEAFCQRERGRQQARALLELFWNDIALNWFPACQKLAGAHSRTYDYLRGLGYLDVQMWVNGWLSGKRNVAPTATPMGGTSAIYPALSRWRPPEQLHQMSFNRLPRLVRQRWGVEAAQSRTHYLLEDVTLGSASANYHNMDMPLTADLPGDRESVRCYFIPDGRHDPYGKIRVPEGPHQKAVHLRPFFTAAQRDADALGLVIYREKDIPKDSTTLESHFVMPRAVDGFWIGDRRIETVEGTPVAFPIGKEESLTLRKGTAGVGVRVLWARGADGQDAPATFVYDGNGASVAMARGRHKFGAVRLTVSHYGSGSGQTAAKNPGAALWVRVGSGLDSDDAFHKWRRQFAAAQAEVEASPERVRIRALGLGGPIVVAAAAPYTAPLELDPSPTRAVLELDREDIGRTILKDIEPIKSYRANVTTPISVPSDRGAYWEAEAGFVMSPMVIARDENASGGGSTMLTAAPSMSRGGQYVWMPGEPGGKGSSSLGSVTWRLKVAKTGNYYIWGRVLAPTPSDDSFFVRAFTDATELIKLAEWHTGTHPQWEWTPITIGNVPGTLSRHKVPGSLSPTPFTLSEGELSLQLRVREDGTKIDRLFITPNPKDHPR